MIPNHLLMTVLVFLIGFCCTAAGMKKPQFSIKNEYQHPVEIKLLNSGGKLINARRLNPGKVVHIGTVQRLMVQVEGNHREYTLPATIYVQSATQTSKPGFVAMLGGKWLLKITASENLGIECLKGGDVAERVNMTITPLGFPRPPRKSDETFDQYQARLLSVQNQLLKGTSN